MLTIPLEKEIEDEHKIIRNLNVRQTIGALGVAIVAFAFYMLTKDVFLTVLLASPFSAVFVLFGWYSKNGLAIEEVLLKKLQSRYFRNDKRSYRSRNSYYAHYNRVYAKERRTDENDKKLQRKIKRARKKAARHKSRLVPVR